MAQDGDSSGDHQDAPKKKGLNLDLLFGPVKHVLTSIGTLRLYGLRVPDMSAFASLSGVATPFPVSARFCSLPHRRARTPIQ